MASTQQEEKPQVCKKQQEEQDSQNPMQASTSESVSDHEEVRCLERLLPPKASTTTSSHPCLLWQQYTVFPLQYTGFMMGTQCATSIPLSSVRKVMILTPWSQ